MTTDSVATGQESEQTPEQLAAEDAAFEAGFNAVTGDQPAAEDTTSQDDAPDDDASNTGTADDEQAQADADAEAAAQAAAAAEAEANAPVVVTKANFERLMALASEVPNLREQITKTHDKTFGRIGELNMNINALKQKADSGNRASIKQLKHLEAEFPELASLLAKDLIGDAEDAGKQPDQATEQSAAATSQAATDPFDDERVKKVLQQKEMKIVEGVHPGFMDLAQTPEFAEWKATLPEVAVKLLGSSWDAETVMIPAFNDFKKWQTEQAAAKTAASSTRQQNDKRLERAITATDGKSATGQHVVDEDAAFLAGFQQARGGR